MNRQEGNKGDESKEEKKKDDEGTPNEEQKKEGDPIEEVSGKKMIENDTKKTFFQNVKDVLSRSPAELLENASNINNPLVKKMVTGLAHHKQNRHPCRRA